MKKKGGVSDMLMRRIAALIAAILSAAVMLGFAGCNTGAPGIESSPGTTGSQSESTSGDPSETLTELTTFETQETQSSATTAIPITTAAVPSITHKPPENTPPIELPKIDENSLSALIEAVKSKDISRLTGKNKEIAAKVIAVIGDIIHPSMSDFEKAKAIHDYFGANYRYDTENYENGTIPDASFEIEGLVLTGVGVCDAYAKSYVLFMESLGIPCERILGRAGDDERGYENHAWNKIKLGSKWYNADITWDDPASAGALCYDYFLIDDTTIGKDHFPELENHLVSAESYDFDRGAITVPEGTKELGDYAFAYTRRYPVTNVILPDSLTHIGEYTFYGCSFLTSVTFGKGITSIGKGAFFHCAALTAFDFPGSVKEISDTCFAYCTALKTVTIQPGVLTIGVNAFSFCTALETVALPDSITGIARSAFILSKPAFICSAGSYAEAFARANRIAVQNY